MESSGKLDPNLTPKKGNNKLKDILTNIQKNAKQVPPSQEALDKRLWRFSVIPHHPVRTEESFWMRSEMYSKKNQKVQLCLQKAHLDINVICECDSKVQKVQTCPYEFMLMLCL